MSRHVLERTQFSLKLRSTWQKMKFRNCSVRQKTDCEDPARRPSNWNLSQKMTPRIWHYRMLTFTLLSMQEGMANCALGSRSYPRINRYSHTSANETILPQLKPGISMRLALIPWSRKLLSFQAKRYLLLLFLFRWTENSSFSVSRLAMRKKYPRTSAWCSSTNPSWVALHQWKFIIFIVTLSNFVLHISYMSFKFETGG